MTLVLVILLVLLFFGGLPTWGWHNYGYTPSGLLLFILLVVVIVYLVRGRT